MTAATYRHLDIPPDASSLAVIRRCWRSFISGERYNPAYRLARRKFYREMLCEHVHRTFRKEIV